MPSNWATTVPVAITTSLDFCLSSFFAVVETSGSEDDDGATVANCRILVVVGNPAEKARVDAVVVDIVVGNGNGSIGGMVKECTVLGADVKANKVAAAVEVVVRANFMLVVGS